MDRESGRLPAPEGRARRCADLSRAPWNPVRLHPCPHLADKRRSAVGACRMPEASGVCHRRRIGRPLRIMRGV